MWLLFFFFFQAEDGIRDVAVTGVQTCALPISNAMKPMGSSGATGTSGSSAAAATIASTYRLDAADSMLSPHVGHKVEITGTLEDRGDSAPSTSSATSSVPSAPKLKVDNVKMIA